ncbi:LPXTG cell wall anchor domain-containing protein [Gardnerella vaginalis]|uniref:LPXTG cell wall anchor domain-containing protein n=1 Tax=Gardnerella vaginalis TaxID=2702 RepID=UPI0039EE40BF
MSVIIRLIKQLFLQLPTEKNPTSVDIANVPTKDNVSWFKLPKTGAAGVIIFALAGVCLVCFGIFVFMRNRKKDEEQAA